MKRPIEINRYLGSAPWFEAYRLNLRETNFLDEKKTRRECLAYIRGMRGEHTISGAFIWADTPQGSEYWRAINKNFLLWLEGS